MQKALLVKAILVAVIFVVLLIPLAMIHGIVEERGASFAAVLTALYGALYGMLMSEDNALLLGSLLMFALVALAMVLTRNVDWYRVGGQEAASPKVAAGS